MVYQVNHQFRQAICRSLVFYERQALGELYEVIRYKPLLLHYMWEKIRSVANANETLHTVLSVLLPMLITIPRRTSLRYSGISSKCKARGNNHAPSFQLICSVSLNETVGSCTLQHYIEDEHTSERVRVTMLILANAIDHHRWPREQIK